MGTYGKPLGTYSEIPGTKMKKLLSRQQNFFLKKTKCKTCKIYKMYKNYKVKSLFFTYDGMKKWIFIYWHKAKYVVFTNIGLEFFFTFFLFHSWEKDHKYEFYSSIFYFRK